MATNTLAELGYPMWKIEQIDGSGIPGVEGSGSFEVLRRADDCTVVGSTDEWRPYGTFPSRADALGFVEETVTFEREATRRILFDEKYRLD